jgi:photosystem II stability/assembly factor-like uncharacterized protein
MTQDANIPTNVYTDEDGAVFVQSQPGIETHYLGACLTADALPNPGPDATPIWCLDGTGTYRSVGRTHSPPGAITTTLTQLSESAGSWLEAFAADDFCPFWVHYIQHKCGTRGTFAHWERAYSILVETITDMPITNLLSREGGNVTERAFNLTAFPYRIDSRELTVARQTTAETEAANDIAACPKACLTECGTGRDTGEYLNVACDAVGAGTANYLVSTDTGTTWTAGATDPFAADENTMATVCFEVDSDTIRRLCVRDGDAAAALEVGYSDDAAATWTNVTVGVTVNEAGTGPQCLFAFDYEHIWLCTDDGRVFFSDDGGASWTDQATALAASGAASLEAIHFADTNVRYAVGATDVVIATVDGGTTWTAATATGGGNTNNTVQVLSRYVLIVGDSGGDIYHSWDGTTNWTQTWSGGAGAVQCISMSTDTTGLMIWDTAAPIGTVYHTIDGGYSWKAYTTPTNVGLNSVIMLSPTMGFAVGEVESATAVILQITGQHIK